MKIAKLLRETLTLILAGGQGERLFPLTRDRAKPAVPFGGHYRIIDFTLSNCINSGLKRIYVLTQYKSQSLDDHLRLGWNIFASAFDEFLFSVPPQLRTGRLVVSGNSRCSLSKYLHSAGTTPPPRSHSFRRPHLQDGLQRDDRSPHSHRCRGHGRRGGVRPELGVAEWASWRSTKTIAS